GIENLRDIQFISSNVGFACSQNSWVYVTTDGGTTWTKTAGPTGILALYFVNQSVGFAVGPSGLIAKTVNGSGVLAVNEINSGNIPGQFLLEQNYPNPFNPSTNIEYQIPNQTRVSISVYDALGRIVATLVNDVKEAGVHTVPFNGSGLASGMYLYRLTAGGMSEMKRMMLVK
ncbi:MAG: T9SS type A sorting domain-containing protein, partial [Bacteroidetes bacterium]|nr:T9SS type A sorting domain-containing protein [Bacteroidota bacterium]